MTRETYDKMNALHQASPRISCGPVFPCASFSHDSKAGWEPTLLNPSQPKLKMIQIYPKFFREVSFINVLHSFLLFLT